MAEFDIQANWVRPSVSLPQSGTRCIVTDGDVIYAATYVCDDSSSIWLITGLTEEVSKQFNVQGWIELPKPIKKVVPYEVTEAQQESHQ